MGAFNRRLVFVIEVLTVVTDRFNIRCLLVSMCLVLTLLCSPLAQGQQSASSPPSPRRNTLPANEKKAALSLPRLALKNGKFMLVTDLNGLLPAGGLAGYGLYADDTRYLSELMYTINGAFPTMLQSSTDEGFAGRFLYGNRAVGNLKEQSILLDREIVLHNGLIERLTLKNFSNEPQSLKLGIRMYTEFEDMFEVRGQTRKERGKILPAQVRRADTLPPGVLLSYEGLDRSVVALDIAVHGAKPININESEVEVELDLEPKSSKTFDVSFQPMLNGKPLFAESKRPESFDQEIAAAREEYARWREGCAVIETSNKNLRNVIERSWRDLYMLRQPTPEGMCMGAGIPWYAAAFGRDQLIVGMQMLPFNQQIAREVLSVLANYQGKKIDAETEEKPGKIMHELRLGEMARAHEIVFAPYFGTIDATPLWMMLLHQYVEWTGDVAFLEKVWGNVERALAYLDAEATAGNGYLRYGYRKGAALANQGWKDSGEAIMHSDGTRAVGPMALCEVQSYLYDAWRGAAALARTLKKDDQAVKLDEKAAALKERFPKDFWMADEKFVALALDGANKPCRVISSNPGHILSGRILTDEQEKLVAERLSRPDMYCGWGIRTLSSNERNYNPMSYHNGSVWPHDNAFCVSGLTETKPGRALAENVVTGLLNVAVSEPDLRLPELFCGFSPEQFSKPVSYPVSCSPQAWAAGSIFQMLSALADIRPDGARLKIEHPSIPAGLGPLAIKQLKLQGKELEVELKPNSDGSTKVQQRTK